METKFDPKKPVQTRDGREAGIYATDGGGDYKIHGWFIGTDGTKRSGIWCENGQHDPGHLYSQLDLINTPEPEVVKYVNFDASGCTDAFDTRGAADYCANGDRIACVRVTYRPGQFDE